MAVASYILPRFRAFDDFGRPMVGAKLYTYQNNTTTPAPTYQDAQQSAANTNPIVLDASGEAIVYVLKDQVYTFVLKDQNDVQVWVQNDVTVASNPSDLDDLETEIKGELLSTASANLGAGMVGFNQARSYATGTVGDQLRNGVTMGSNRGGYIVSGVARRDTSIAPNWEMIQDSTHKPMNGLTAAGGSTDLILNFKEGPVGAMICGPDETFAKDGACFGISGGGGTALMSIGVPCTFEIDLATATISKYNTRYFASSRFSVAVSGTTGGITITHPPSFSHFRPIVQHSAANLLSEPLLPHYVLNSGLGGGTTTLQLLGEAEGQVTYNGSSWGITTSAWTNAECTFSYDAGTGVMTVTHPPVVGSPGLSVTPLIQSSGTFIAGAAAVPTATGFQVRFRTLLDTVPTLVSGLGFLFSRGISAPRKAPTGTLLVDVGRVQAAANQVDSSTGNVWIIGVNNLS